MKVDKERKFFFDNDTAESTSCLGSLVHLYYLHM